MRLAALTPALFVLVSMCGSPLPAPPGSVSGTVYFDANHNRLHDTCDRTLSATVSLATSDGKATHKAPVVNGVFQFASVPAGEAVLTLTSEADLFWPMTQRTSDDRPGVSITVESQKDTAGVELASISFIALARNSDSVVGTVFDDANRNGKVDRDECGLSGAGVIRDGSNSRGFVSQPGDGSFAFTSGSGSGPVYTRLSSGSWEATTVPEGADPCLHGVTPVHSGDGNVYEAVIGFTSGIAQGWISGTLYDDANRNGIRDEGETGVSQAGVYAEPINRTCGASPSATTYADENGDFLIKELVPGHYELSLGASIAPSGNLVSQGWPNTTDVLTTDGGAAIELPLIIQPAGTITVSIFSDLDGDGTRDANENPPSVVACLYGTGSVGAIANASFPHQVCARIYRGTALFERLPWATYDLRIDDDSWPIPVSTDVVLSGPQAMVEIALPPIGRDPIATGAGGSMPTTTCYSDPEWVQPSFEDGFDPNATLYQTLGVDELAARAIYANGFYQTSPIRRSDPNVWAEIAGLDWRLPPGCSMEPSRETVFTIVGFEPTHGVKLGTIRQVFVEPREKGLFAVEIPVYLYLDNASQGIPSVVLFVDDLGNLLARCDGEYCERLDD